MSSQYTIAASARHSSSDPLPQDNRSFQELCQTSPNADSKTQVLVVINDQAGWFACLTQNPEDRRLSLWCGRFLPKAVILSSPALACGPS